MIDVFIYQDCPNCKAENSIKINADDFLIWVRVKCSKCGRMFKVKINIEPEGD